MDISEGEFVSIFLIFLCLVAILKNIEFLLRRSRIYWLTHHEAKKIYDRLNILENWMGMDLHDESSSTDLMEDK